MSTWDSMSDGERAAMRDAGRDEGGRHLGSRAPEPRRSVVKIICRSDGARTPFDGRYLRAWDFDAVTLDVVSDPAEARIFPNGAEALAAWRSVHEARPVRPDGKPNRPLTAFTVEVVALDLAVREP